MDSVISKIQQTLPKNWIAKFSKNYKNRVFYFNTSTGKSSWIHPTQGEITGKVQCKNNPNKQSAQSLPSKKCTSQVGKDEGVQLLPTPKQLLKRMDISKKSHKTHSILPVHKNVNKGETSKSTKFKKTIASKSLQPKVTGFVKKQSTCCTNTLCTPSHVTSSHCMTKSSRLPVVESPSKKFAQRKRKIKKETSTDGDESSGLIVPSKKQASMQDSQLSADKIKSKKLIERNVNNLKKIVPTNINKTTMLQQNMTSNHIKVNKNPSIGGSSVPHTKESFVSPIKRLQATIPKLPLPNITSLIDADVEMDDISSSLGESSAMSKASLSQSSVLFVVVDTNVFLEANGLEHISKIIDWHPLPNGYFRRSIIVVPWVVLQELDHMKSNKKIKTRARQAIGFLNGHFSSKKLGIRGQTIMEAASFFDGLPPETNDDRILQCLYFFSQMQGFHVTLLFTYDINLCNKALVSNFRTFSSIECLLKGITMMCTDPNLEFDKKRKTPNYSPRGESNTIDINDNVELDCKKNDSRDNNDNVVIECPSSNSTNLLSILQTEQLLCTALSTILETEMRKGYGDNLWEEIVLLKPPWSLQDVLMCVKKHWIAVFSMIGVDRLASVHVERLLRLVKCNSLVSASPDKEGYYALKKDFSASAIALLKAITSRRKYNQKVTEAVAALEGQKRRVSETSAEKTQVRNTGDEQRRVLSSGDQMPSSPLNCCRSLSAKDNEGSGILEQESCTTVIAPGEFWKVLDQVWSSIVVHCVAIFRSLSFVTSPAFSQSPPELQRQLVESVEEIPSPEMALRVLPLLLQMIEGLVATLEIILQACQSEGSVPTLAQCLDLLQTLWTTSQALSIQTNVESLRPPVVQSCATDQNDKQQLHTGYKKLVSVHELLKDCHTIRDVAQSLGELFSPFMEHTIVPNNGLYRCF